METQHKICIIKLWYEPVLWLLVYLCDFSAMQAFQCNASISVQCKHFSPEIKAVRPLYEAAFSEQDLTITWTCGKVAR